MATNVGTIELIATINTSQYKKGAEEIKKSNKDIESSASKTDRSTRMLGTSFKSISRTMTSDLGSALKDTGRQILDLGKRVVSIAWEVAKKGALVFGAAIVALGGFGVKTAASIESMQISMIGLTKSVKKGNKAMSGALKFAQKAPFQLDEVVDTTRQLIAFGIGSKQAVKELDLLGNVSLTTGVGLKDLGFMFGRVASSGRVMAEDINQLTSHGVSILPALQKTLGKTAEEVRSLASDGKLGFKEFKTAMETIVDPKIMGMLENTLPRQWDRLKGSIRILSFAFVGASVDMEKGFTKARHGIAQATVDITRSLADLMRNPKILKAAESMGTTIALILGEIPKTIENNMKSIEKTAGRITKFFDKINRQLIGQQSAKKGGGTFSSGFGAQETQNQGGVKNFVNQLSGGIKQGIEKLDFKSILSKIFDAIGNMGGEFTQAFVKLVATVDYESIVAALVANLPKIIDGFIFGFFRGLVDGFKKDPVSFLTTIIGLILLPAKVIGVVAKALSKIPLFGPLLSFFTKSINKLGEPVRKLFGGVLTKIKDKILSFFAPAGTWLTSKGKIVIDGLARGLKSVAGKVTGAVKVPADKIGQFFKGAGRWLVDTGKALIEGLITGIKSMAGKAGQATKGVVNKIKDWLPGSPARVGPFSGRGYTLLRGQRMIEDFARGIRKGAPKVTNQIQQLVNLSASQPMVSAANRLSKHLSNVNNRIEKANKKLSSLRKSRADMIKSISGGITSSTNITEGFDQGAVTTDSIRNRLAKQLDTIKSFQRNLSNLAKKGLSKSLLRQIAEAGVEAGGATALALSTASKNEIKQINTLQKQIGNSAKGIGTVVGNSFFQSGIRAAQGLIKGLKSSEKQIENQLNRIAKMMSGALKKALGIASPSRVFTWLGDMIMQGLIKGIERTGDKAINAVSSVSRDMHNIAGVSNRGEYVLPQSFMNQNTGLPQVGGTTIEIGNITIAKEVDADRFFERLTKEQEIISKGMTPGALNV